ncbi:MAG TPA: MerR family DNA-binding transcriptional regulator, partial [Candidatus Aphodousia faecalis]|nr:MerR family DNA-binding transcriptional regulator [Candidatus Aphodousia faecalis]
MNRFYSISKAATELGVSISTLRRRESEGKLVPQRTKG